MAEADGFDIIIVGCGNAGSVLAARLTEVPSLRVLVLEAGGDHDGNRMVELPAGGKALWDDERDDDYSSINWGFKTAPQENYEGRVIDHRGGKGLGGTTLINWNCMSFPDRGSIDNFARLGNEGWAYDDLQPYYRKFHTFHKPSAKMVAYYGLSCTDPSLHGTSGPIQVSYGGQLSGQSMEWSRTFKALGRKSTADVLSGDTVGSVNAPGSINQDWGFTRSSAAARYLTAQVRRRGNLDIVTNARVKRVVLERDGDDKIIARGVSYTSEDGQSHDVRAREVILSGGVFSSPQLLEVSGIGDPRILGRLGIEPAVDLAGVGENLQDHATVAVSLESTCETMDDLRDMRELVAAFKFYKKYADGDLTSGTFSQAYLPCLDMLLSAAGRRELAEMLDKHAKAPSSSSSSSSSSSAGLQKQYDIIRSIVEDPEQSSVQYSCASAQASADQSSWERPADEGAHSADPSTPHKPPTRPADCLTLYTSLSHPFSRGNVHITSSDISEPPRIDPKYFSNPVDRELMARHLRFLPTIYETPPFAKFVNHSGDTIPADLDLRNLKYARRLVETGSTAYNPCGTCSMMPREDGGVVDSHLRVYGVEGLRVVDASVFPLIPRGNIQSSVYAVAEKAADIITADFGLAGEKGHEETMTRESYTDEEEAYSSEGGTTFGPNPNFDIYDSIHFGGPNHFADPLW